MQQQSVQLMPPAENIFSDMRLLIIDDEPFNVEILEEILFDAGYQHVISDTDPRNTLEHCENHRPDLILLDLQMPYLDGFEIIKRLKNDAALCNIPTLVITAQTNRDYRLRALNLGAKDFITKPFDSSEVLTRIHNLLETQQLYNNLKNQNQQLHTLNNAMSELVSIVSHELRTPLTSIKSFVEILRDESDNLDDASKNQFLRIIDNETDRLSRLISNLLDLQKMNSGKMTWHTELVDLVKVTQDTLEFFKPAFHDKGLEISLDSDIQVGHVMTDPDKIRQVLMNVLSNALKFTQLGGVSVTIKHNNAWANVLLLSSDEVISNQLTEILTGVFVNFVHETGRENVLEQLERSGGKIDVLIVDISHADVENINFLEQLRATYPSLPITVIVSDDEKNDSRHKTTFIKKPLDMEKSRAAIELQISDLIGLSPQTNMIEISIADTGSGIPVKDLNKVFERFHQVDTSHTREQSGTGLGLTICSEIINHYYGRIWVESEHEKGSVFKIILPELHKEKKKLGEILVEKGLVTEEQLSNALKYQA